jgi:hypothetical protein
MVVSPSVTVIICWCILAHVSWNLDQAASNFTPLREVFTTNLTFVDLTIKNILEYIGVSSRLTRYVFVNDAAFSSSSIWTHNASTYHHISKPIVSEILGYKNLNHADEIRKQWKH